MWTFLPRTDARTCGIWPPAARTALLVSTALASGACVDEEVAPLRDPGPYATATLGSASCDDVPIERFGLVVPGVYRGAQPDAEGLRALRRLGVRTVLDLRWDHDERAQVEAAGMVPLALPLPSGRRGRAPTTREVDRFLEIVTDPAAQPVFVHCSHGRDRTGALFAAYRMAVGGWTREEAISEMRAHGSRGDHAALDRFIHSYEPRESTRPTRRASN